MQEPSPRAHTGRRRNDAARQAILAAATELIARSGGALTVGDIAVAAGVSKHTIYRWWPSKGAVLLDAAAEWARATAPDPDTGSLATDLRVFLEATFAAAADPATAALLRAVLAEAQADSHTAELLSAFIDGRRDTLRGILLRARDRGEFAAEADLEIVIDQVYGVLWYRLAVVRAPVNSDIAARLADSILSRA